MKGAIILILMLLMGFITAQSIDAMGYDISAKDTIYLQNIFSTIEEKGGISTSTEKKFLPYLTYFPKNSRQYVLLHEIYTYIQTQTSTDTTVLNSSTYTKEMIRLLGSQFN